MIFLVVIILPLGCGGGFRMEFMLKCLRVYVFRLMPSFCSACRTEMMQAAALVQLHCREKRAHQTLSSSFSAPFLVSGLLHSALNFSPQTIKPTVSAALCTSHRASGSWQIYQSSSSSWYGCGSPCCFIILRNIQPTDFVSLTFLFQ